jgi:hypothetical protein
MPSEGEEPIASAASGSQKMVMIPRAVRKINVAATTVEVLSAGLAAGAAATGLRFGVAAIGRSINNIMKSRTNLVRGRLLATVAIASLTLAFSSAAVAKAANKPAGPKFYFQVHEVKAVPEVDAALKAYAGEALEAELASRPEWASDVGTATGNAEALVAELKKRNLRGFEVTLRIVKYQKDLKEPSPGARRKRLSLTVGVAVFGTTIPEAKLSFSGDGESGLETEVSDKGVDVETTAAAKDALKDAIKQAVDQAVLKLPVGTSTPHKHGKRK